MPGAVSMRLLLLAIAALSAGPSRAADDTALHKDLGSVIVLLGLPCGQVTGAERQADNDHLATCSNGSRYRVFVNTEGRVVAQKAAKSQKAAKQESAAQKR